MKAIHGEHDAKNTKYNDYPAKSGRATKMSNNSTCPISDEFDEYPEVSPADLEEAVHRRNFVEIHKQSLSVNVSLD